MCVRVPLQSAGLGAGVAYLKFDNSYSSFRGKRVWYKLRVVPAAEATAAAHSEMTYRTKMNQVCVRACLCLPLRLLCVHIRTLCVRLSLTGNDANDIVFPGG